MARKRTAVIQIRLLPSELEMLKQVAEKEGLSVSEYIREKALKPAPSILAGDVEGIKLAHSSTATMSIERSS